MQKVRFCVVISKDRMSSERAKSSLHSHSKGGKGSSRTRWLERRKMPRQQEFRETFFFGLQGVILIVRMNIASIFNK